MGCYRFDLRRKYLQYLHGRLSQVVQQKIEQHLLDCPSCRARLEKLGSTEKRLKDLPRVAPSSDVWDRISAGLDQKIAVPAPSHLWQKVAVLAVFGLASGLLGAAAYVKLSGHEKFFESGIRTGEFKPVSIPHMAITTEPHVVTEGYVTEAKIEEEDGDTVFKLVENPKSSGPFVICEVIDPLNLPIPPVGSRVRVYGVSRYDAKADHQWHEVHPVLNIEVLKN